MKKTKSKTKICLSLLIAMAFIIPSAAVYGNSSTESTVIIEASEYNERIPFENKASTMTEIKDGEPIEPLAWNNGWPVEVNSINIGSPIAAGEYDVTATFCRPDFFLGMIGWITIYVDTIGTVSINSDCDTVWLQFNTTGGVNRPMNNLVVTTTGGHIFDANSYVGCSGDNSKVVTFEIPRDELRVGDCNEKGFNIDWVNTLPLAADWTGHIGQNAVKELIAYDCGTAEIKKFLEIYKEQEIPEVTDNLYCQDFEDPCEFYDEWATYDMSPDWGNNGAIDTWTWTDKKSNSPDHSFHSTAGDTYLMNQHDILEFNMDMEGFSLTNETGVLYDYVNITWAHWMEGDTIISGNTQLIQDGGYVEVAFWDGIGVPALTWTTVSEVFFETDGWEDEFVNIPVEDEFLFVRFVFFSDAAFCYEGWYIDDVCIDGIQDEFGEWEFVTDSHSHEQVMEEQCIDHTFIESWVAEEGTYKICVWLQTLDDCHYAVHGSDIFAEDPDINDAYCIIVEVEDCLDYEALGLTFDPADPAWEGDDVEICAETVNGGTLDGLDAQVRVTVQYGAVEITENNVPCDSEIMTEDTRSDTDWYKTWDNDFWHVTDYDQPGDCYIANFDETTLAYNTDVAYSRLVGPENLYGRDKDLDVTVEFDAAWSLPDDYADAWADSTTWHIGVIEVGAGGYLYNAPYDINDPTMGQVSAGNGGWVHIGPVSIGSLLDSMVSDSDYGGLNDKFAFCILFFKNHYTTDSGGAYDGIKLDNLVIKKLAIQEEPIIFQETKIIDNTPDFAENNFNVSETNITCFTWEDAGVGRYLVTQEVLGDTCDLTNNSYITSYNVVNYREDMEDGDVEFIDNTCVGDSHWQIDDCCGGSLWVGDYETTMYGEFYDDCLYIAPYDEDLGEQNRTQAFGGEILTYWTWYQINDTDDPANFSGDWAIVEMSEDGGQHWYTMEAYNGESSPTSDPDGEADWEKHTYGIPANVDQIRFRFESDNDTVENRGWMLDNISIPGIIDDECESMENFDQEIKCYGNWWQSPDQYHYYMLDWPGTIYHVPGMYDAEECWWWWEGGDDVIPDFANTIEDPASTYGCFDNSIPFAPCAHYELYPQEINNSIEWTIDMSGMFFGYIRGFHIADMGHNDTATMAYSVDSGSSWTKTVGLAGYGKLRETYLPITNADLMGSDTLKYKYTVVTDDDDNVTFDATYFSTIYGGGYGYCGLQLLGLSDVAFGATMNEYTFFGMKDNTAPMSTISMSGTFDDVYKYYTSSVKVTITAADDVSGVANIYYELDGTQQTYNGEFTVSGNGEHTLCYWAVDNEGNVEVKKCVAPFRIDTAGPSVSINIEPGIYLFGNKLLSSEKYIFLFGGVPMTATASADGAPLKTVEFYINDVLFAEDTTSPFAAMCREKNTGGATFKVVAEDVLGQTASATQVVDTYIKIL